MWLPPCRAHYRAVALGSQEGASVRRPELVWIQLDGSPFLELILVRQCLSPGITFGVQVQSTAMPSISLQLRSDREALNRQDLVAGVERSILDEFSAKP
jgi:hypothetical protein